MVVVHVLATDCIVTTNAITLPHKIVYLDNKLVTATMHGCNYNMSSKINAFYIISLHDCTNVIIIAQEHRIQGQIILKQSFLWIKAHKFNDMLILCNGILPRYRSMNNLTLKLIC